MNNEDNINEAYKGDQRPCALCGKCVDCGAMPKPFVIYRGKPAHWNCMENARSMHNPRSSNRVLQFFDRHMEKNLVIQAVILYLQIPHMLWTADLAFLEQQLLAGISTPLDFLLYGVDLLEFVAIASITVTLIARYKVRGRLL